MESARLNEIITIEKEGRVPNGQGGFKAGWVAVVKREPAQVVPISGGEDMRNNVERTLASYRIRIRRRESLKLTTQMRIRWDSSAGETLSIRSALPDVREPRAFLAIEADLVDDGSE